MADLHTYRTRAARMKQGIARVTSIIMVGDAVRPAWLACVRLAQLELEAWADEAEKSVMAYIYVVVRQRAFVLDEVWGGTRPGMQRADAWCCRSI